MDDSQYHLDATAKIVALAKSFSVLAGHPAVLDWDANALDQWAAGPCSGGEQIVAQFVLRVWDHSNDWKCGNFDMFEAYMRLDPSAWSVVTQWASRPFLL